MNFFKRDRGKYTFYLFSFSILVDLFLDTCLPSILQGDICMATAQKFLSL